MASFAGCNIMEIVYDGDGVTPIGKVELDLTIDNIRIDTANLKATIDINGILTGYEISENGTYAVAVNPTNISVSDVDVETAGE